MKQRKKCDVPVRCAPTLLQMLTSLPSTETHNQAQPLIKDQQSQDPNNLHLSKLPTNLQLSDLAAAADVHHPTSEISGEKIKQHKKCDAHVEHAASSDVKRKKRIKECLDVKNKTQQLVTQQHKLSAIPQLHSLSEITDQYYPPPLKATYPYNMVTFKPLFQINSQYSQNTGNLFCHETGQLYCSATGILSHVALPNNFPAGTIQPVLLGVDLPAQTILTKCNLYNKANTNQGLMKNSKVCPPSKETPNTKVRPIQPTQREFTPTADTKPAPLHQNKSSPSPQSTPAPPSAKSRPAPATSHHKEIATASESKPTLSTYSKPASSLECKRGSFPLGESFRTPQSAPPTQNKPTQSTQYKSASYHQRKPVPYIQNKSAPFPQSKPASSKQNKPSPCKQIKQAPSADKNHAPSPQSKSASFTKSKTSPCKQRRHAPSAQRNHASSNKPAPHAKKKSTKYHLGKETLNQTKEKTSPSVICKHKLPKKRASNYVSVWSYVRPFNRNKNKKIKSNQQGQEELACRTICKNHILTSMVHDIIHSQFVKIPGSRMSESQVKILLNSGGPAWRTARPWTMCMEEEALHKYRKLKLEQENQRVKVEDWDVYRHHENTWLVCYGRMVTDRHTKESWPLLVKCLHKHPDSTLRQASKHRSFCLTWHGGYYTLRKDHHYYTQIQCHMAILEALYAELLVHTHMDTLIVPVWFDFDFWEKTESTLERFYFENVLPLLQKRGVIDTGQLQSCVLPNCIATDVPETHCTVNDPDAVNASKNICTDIH